MLEGAQLRVEESGAKVLNKSRGVKLGCSGYMEGWYAAWTCTLARVCMSIWGGGGGGALEWGEPQLLLLYNALFKFLVIITSTTTTTTTTIIIIKIVKTEAKQWGTSQFFWVEVGTHLYMEVESVRRGL